MQLTDFHFILPDKLIARYPLSERSQSRLLCLDRISGVIEHQKFHSLVDKVNPGDLLIFNDTKVIPARLHGRKVTGGKVEIMVERILNQAEVKAMIKASKSPAIGSEILLADDHRLVVLDKDREFYKLRVISDYPILDILYKYGEIPIPPYFQRDVEDLDSERYQTVYARHEGAVAAPTAGLHFDDELLNKLQIKGVNFGYLTLHVGAGTFLPVRVDNLSEHKMHKEYIVVSKGLCQQIHATKARGNKVIAVGTTSVRALETASRQGAVKAFQGDTDIFIYPGFTFNCIDAMITNFHLPESTLLMLVSAYAGRDNIMNAYQQAVLQEYRFFSYGDAMLIM